MEFSKFMKHGSLASSNTSVYGVISFPISNQACVRNVTLFLEISFITFYVALSFNSYLISVKFWLSHSMMFSLFRPWMSLTNPRWGKQLHGAVNFIIWCLELCVSFVESFLAKRSRIITLYCKMMCQLLFYYIFTVLCFWACYTFV